MKTIPGTALTILRFAAWLLVFGWSAPTAWALVQVPVTVTIAGDGQVVSSPLGITCTAASSPCTHSFLAGATVTLAATAATGYAFDHWTTALGDSSVNPLSTTVPSQPASITAVFLPLYALTVTRAGTGAGNVTSSPAGIGCAATCSADFRSGTVVTLTATPDSGSVFLSWSGACSGADATCYVTMDAAKGTTATFVPPYAGALDPFFGTRGIATGNQPAVAWDVRAMALGTGDKVYFAGMLYDGVDKRAAVGRLTSGGQLDTYGVSGIDSVAIGGSGATREKEIANAIVTLPDGSAVIAGAQVVGSDSSFLLAKRLPGGGPDNAFGTSGKVTHTSGIGFTEHFALAKQPDGRLVAAGRIRIATEVDVFSLVRYTAGGSLDPTFGVGGIAFAQFGSSRDVARAVAIQPDGRIVVAGYSGVVGPAFNVGIARFNSDGSTDSSFGTNGKVILLPQSGSNGIEAFGLALQPDGKILVAAAKNNGANEDMIVFRVGANGALDPGFGSGGSTTVNIGYEAPWSLALQANGKILVSGQTGPGTNGGPTSFALVRLLPDGAPDASFGASGVIQQSILAPNNRATAVKVMADGRIVVAGGAGLGFLQGDWAVARYYGDPLPQYAETDFNADGRSDMLYRNGVTGQVYRFLMTGMATSSGALAYTEANTAWKIVGDADFNGDSVGDLLWRNDSTGQVYYQPFGLNGMPSGGTIFYTEPNLAWKIVHTPDLDGDGRADILWWNSTTGQVYAMLMNGSTILAESLFYTEPNTAWKVAAVGDFSGTGKQNQLLWRHSTTGQVFLMTVTISGSTFTQTGVMIYHEPNTAWRILAAADFNGDGRSDILWRNVATGQVFALLMNGTTIAGGGLVYAEPNLAWKVVAHGDYDGDGKPDLLWRNDSTGQVYMMLMNGMAIQSQGFIYNEPNVAWKILGPWENGLASGTLDPP